MTQTANIARQVMSRVTNNVREPQLHETKLFGDKNHVGAVFALTLQLLILYKERTPANLAGVLSVNLTGLFGISLPEFPCDECFLPCSGHSPCEFLKHGSEASFCGDRL